MDAFAPPIYHGEGRYPYGQASADSGTLTITGSPTYTLYGPTGSTVAGHIAQAVDGYDQSAAATVKVWKKISPTLATMPEGNYKIVFTFSATHSVTGQSETFVRTVGVPIKAVPG